MTTKDKHSSWLSNVRLIKSPNWDLRPQGTVIDLIVVHSISLPPGEFGGPWIDELFQNRLDCSAHPYFANLRGLHVSSHLLIRRDGSITQYVPLELRAWHAGPSSFQGRSNCNNYSIGIELEGCDTVDFTPQQYQSLVTTTQVLMQSYPAITVERITGHSVIAPGRKTDPGPTFDWIGYIGSLDI